MNISAFASALRTHLAGPTLISLLHHRSGDDTRTRSIVDLRGRVYAFSDPQSNSGCLVPKVELLRAGVMAAELFLKFFFTYSHRRVVDAVSVGLADGGSVDGYVWETMKKELPGSTDKTRVAWKFSAGWVSAIGCAFQFAGRPIRSAPERVRGDERGCSGTRLTQ